MQDIGSQGLGLTANQLIASLNDADLRDLIDPSLLSTLDAIGGGNLGGDGLRRAASAVIDLQSLLTQSSRRAQVLNLLSDAKAAELEDRIGRPPGTLAEISASELRSLYEFFGIDEEYVLQRPSFLDEDITPDYGLFEHQRGAVQDLQQALSDEGRRALLHLPTGVGKTRTAMHIVARTLCEHDPCVVVWLASGRELLEQAVSAFREAWQSLGNRGVAAYGMWGQESPDLDSIVDGFLAIGLSKAWVVMQRKDPDWAARLASRVRLVVFDEAHQSIAPTYRHIVEELTLDHRCALLGLSATPGRTWDDIDEDGRLSDFFEGTKIGLQVPSNNPIEYLIDNGYLSRPSFRTVLADPGFSPSATEIAQLAEDLDLPAAILESLTLTHQYIAAVVRSIDELLQNGHERILVFAASVPQSQVLAALLAIRGTRCEVVTATSSIQLRARAVSRFKLTDSTPMVLLNYGVLTTGFDAPKATAVVIARPTRSLVLYSQMVGRGIRGPLAGGTADCEIVSVVDPSLPGFGDIADAFLNWEDVW